jgi:hypothetical protein
VSEREDRAVRVNPDYTHGPLVKIARALNQPEAELLESMLLDQGIPSLQRRSPGVDVPDFLAAGARDILVPQSAVDVAREALSRPVV